MNKRGGALFGLLINTEEARSFQRFPTLFEVLCRLYPLRLRRQISCMAHISLVFRFLSQLTLSISIFLLQLHGAAFELVVT